MTHKRSHEEAFPDEDDQWIFDPQLDAAILASRQEEEEEQQQQRGGSLLEFTLEPTGPRRRWQNVLNKQRYQARLQQSRDATPRDDLGREVTQALRRALLRQIETDPTLTPHSTLHFTMQSGAFDHAFQSATFRVREVQEDSERLSTYLQTLAQKLNSNQAFTPDDTFDLETTFIRTPGPGRGNGKRYKPASAAARGLVKRSVATIKNRDALCCARAIVTMRAWADEQARVFPPCEVQDVEKWSTESGTVGQRTPSIGGRTRRSLRHPRTDVFSSRVARLPDQGHVHRSPAHDRLQGGGALGQNDSPHPRGRPLQRLHLLRWIPVQILLLPRVRSRLRPRDVLRPSLRRQVVQGLPPPRLSGLPGNQTDSTSGSVSGALASLPPLSPPLLRGRVSRASCRRQAVPLSNYQEMPRLPKNLRDQVQTGTTLRTPTQVRVGSVPHLRPTRGFGHPSMLHPARGPRR